MIVSFNISTIKSNDWVAIRKVGIWLASSMVLAGVLAWVANNPFLVVTTPIINMIGVILSKFFTQEENQAISQLPKDLQQEASVVSELIQTPPTASGVSNLSVNKTSTSIPVKSDN